MDGPPQNEKQGYARTRSDHLAKPTSLTQELVGSCRPTDRLMDSQSVIEASIVVSPDHHLAVEARAAHRQGSTWNANENSPLFASSQAGTKNKVFYEWHSSKLITSVIRHRPERSTCHTYSHAKSIVFTGTDISHLTSLHKLASCSFQPQWRQDNGA